MKPALVCALLLLAPLAASSPSQDTRAASPAFPPELVAFGPASPPLLAGTGTATWDRKVRERGWIMREGGTWHLWYTGYNDDLSPSKFLGYATSPDGVTWTRWPGNPLTTTVRALPNWGEWTTCLAVSDDLVHWRKYGGNPVLPVNPQSPGASSSMLIHDGTAFRLFTTHPDVRVYRSRSPEGAAAVVPGGVRTHVSSLDARIAPPTGYRRIDVTDGSFAQWLRGLPLKKDGTRVRLFDGREKANQDAHVAVIDLDVGPKNLQQCADAVIRLRAEWQFARALRDEIRFSLTSGALAEFARWSEGYRPLVSEHHAVRWVKTAPPDASYASFRGYLERVFQYAGTASLSRDLQKVADTRDVRIGDVYIKGGYPGHAVIVVDAAENAAGQRVFLLAQSYMPAQDIHILRNPVDPNLSPWYSTAFGERLDTPEWTFARSDLRRFGS